MKDPDLNIDREGAFPGVSHNLFIIAPNNSGSTLMRTALSTCEAALHLEREGQNVTGFDGPSTRSTGARLIWAARDEWLALFMNPANYNWAKIKEAWHRAAISNTPKASVFVTSSPPFLCQVATLKAEFKGSKFIFMVRNPYAVAEGILRRTSQQDVRQGEDIRCLAAKHIVRCLNIQRQNIDAHGQDGLFISYEALCQSPAEMSDRIVRFEPAFADIDFETNLPVKNIYNEPLRNMNADHINRLSKGDAQALNSVFRRYEPLFKHFGYGLMTV